MYEVRALAIAAAAAAAAAGVVEILAGASIGDSRTPIAWAAVVEPLPRVAVEGEPVWAQSQPATLVLSTKTWMQVMLSCYCYPGQPSEQRFCGR